MDINPIYLVLCGAFGLVVLLNAGLVISLLRNQAGHPYQGILNVFKAARDPWKNEDRTLEELKTRVADLQKEPEKGRQSE